MYKRMFQWHVSYTYNRFLYYDQDADKCIMSHKCFGSLDSRKKELKEFYEYNRERLEFSLDVNTML